MTEWYRHINLKNWEDGNAARYIYDGGQNPINLRMTTKYFEAETYRAVFKAYVERRLISVTKAETDFESDLNYFFERNQGNILQHLIMNDFYYNEPTTQKCAFEKMGGDHRRARTLLDGAINCHLIVKEPLPTDNRKFILFPTIRMVSAYERRVSQTIWEIEMRQKRNPEQHHAILEILKYDSLRKKYLPIDVANQIAITLADFAEIKPRRGPQLY
jgi:hypothetical protein